MLETLSHLLKVTELGVSLAGISMWIGLTPSLSFHIHMVHPSQMSYTIEDRSHTTHYGNTGQICSVRQRIYINKEAGLALSPGPSPGFLLSLTFLYSIANLDKLPPKHTLEKHSMQYRVQASAHADRVSKSSGMFLSFHSCLYLKIEFMRQEKKTVVHSFDEGMGSVFKLKVMNKEQILKPRHWNLKWITSYKLYTKMQTNLPKGIKKGLHLTKFNWLFLIINSTFSSRIWAQVSETYVSSPALGLDFPDMTGEL